MNANFFVNLERTAYPIGKVFSEGEHLRQLTTNQSTYIPAIKPTAAPEPFLPIFVPTSRHVIKNRKNIKRLMQLVTERNNSFLIFLCSGPAKKDDIAVIAKDFPNLRWIAIDGPFLRIQSFKTKLYPLYASDSHDQDEKRNLALRVARLMHWNEVFFLDDDVTITSAQIDKAHALLQQKNVSVVGFSTRDFPDLSVAMHAYRWVHDDIDSFIGAGALAVKTSGSFISFFPQTYNEDWLFLLAYHLADAGKVVWAGTIQQRPFNPFRSPHRAVAEEVGDLVAEGLYKVALTLYNSDVRHKDIGDLMTRFCKHADEDFWNAEINNRIDYLHTVREDIRTKKLRPIRKTQVIRALNQAIKCILDSTEDVSGKSLANWTKAWCKDIEAWNRLPKPKRPYETIIHALNALSPAYSFRGDIDERPTNTRTVPYVPRQTGIYQGYTLYTRTRAQKEGLWLTQIIQQYFSDKHIKMEEIAASANALRFDRPVAEIPAIKPGFTICIVIQYGESVALLRQSVASIQKWTRDKGAGQITVWVYSGATRQTKQRLEAYRNHLTSQLVYDLASTNLQLRSGVINQSKKRISKVIESLLNDISFAYWKIGINPKHPIFVVNSRNDLLHLSTFGQFVHQEQQLTYRSTRQMLEALPTATAQKIRAEDDKQSLHEARQRLAHKTSVRTAWFDSTTKRMVYRMKKARLTWLEQDDLAYNVAFHSPEGRNSIDSIKQVICMAIPYNGAQTHHQAIISEIQKQASSKSTAYLVVIYGHPNTPWKVLNRHRRELMKKFDSDKILVSMAYRLAPGETLAIFKRRVLSTIEYTYWLQNHQQQINIRWRHLHK